MKKPQQEWRFKGGRYIHDGDCYFWQSDVCTCGLIHQLIPNPPLQENGEVEKWFGIEWARQSIQLRRIPKPLPYKEPTKEELEERQKIIEEVFPGIDLDLTNTTPE